MCKTTSLVLFATLFLAYSNSEGGLWNGLGGAEFNQKLFARKYDYKIEYFVPKEGTPNNKLWTSGGEISYIIYERNREELTKDSRRRMLEMWKLEIPTLKSYLVAKKIPSPFVSNDGRRLAYIDNTNLKIGNIGSKAENVFKLEGLSTKDNIHVGGWSPDGLKISLYSNSQTSGKLWIFAIDRKALKLVAEVGDTSQNYGIFIAWSPNSNMLLFPTHLSSTETRYHIATLNRAAIQDISMPKGISYAEPSWTVSRYIVFYGYNLNLMKSNEGVAGVREDDFSDIFLFDLKKNKARKLFAINRRSDFYPVLSPDGLHMVFYGRDIEGNTKLMLSNINADYCVALDEKVTPAQPPIWSPDSKRIAYDKLAPSGQIAIGIVSLVRK